MSDEIFKYCPICESLACQSSKCKKCNEDEIFRMKQEIEILRLKNIQLEERLKVNTHSTIIENNFLFHKIYILLENIQKLVIRP